MRDIRLTEPELGKLLGVEGGEELGSVLLGDHLQESTEWITNHHAIAGPKNSLHLEEDSRFAVPCFSQQSSRSEFQADPESTRAGNGRNQRDEPPRV